MFMVAAFVAGNCSEVRSVHVVLGLCDAKLGVRSVREVLSLRCGCSCVWSGGVGYVVLVGGALGCAWCPRCGDIQVG